MLLSPTMAWPGVSDLSAAVDELVPILREVRHDLHAHPELGFEEHRTQQVVREWLEGHDYVTRDCAGTGLVADLAPDAPGPAIALRADLDCLPMQEHTDLPYRSRHEGRAHKCGHDGHTAILMGVAAVLAGRRGQAPRNIRLLFQPAEEGVRGGGARVMLEQGALENVAEVYGLHNWPAFPKGQIRVAAGPTMARTHELFIDIKGIGAHGSQPQAGRDPIVAGAAMVSALQTAISRGLGADGGAVVSVCSFQAGNTTNVIPDRARLTGTIRSFRDDVTERVLSRVREVVSGTAATFGVDASLDLRPGYPALVNSEACAAAVVRAAGRVVGPEHVSSEGIPIAGGEDFSYLAEAVPGAYFFLGAGVDGQETPGCHHPDFDFDDDLIAQGVRTFLALVEDRCEALARPDRP